MMGTGSLGLLAGWVGGIAGILFCSPVIASSSCAPELASEQASDTFPVSLEASDARIRMSVVGSYRGGMFSEKTPGGPPAYDPWTKRVYVASADRRAIEGIDVSDPSHPVQVISIDLNPYGGEANAIAIHRGVLALTVEDADDDTQPGKIVFLNLEGKLLAEPLTLGRLSRIAFAPDGSRLVATISGSPNDEYTEDPESGIVVAELPGTTWFFCRIGSRLCTINPQVTLLDFRAFNDQRNALIEAGVRILFPTATVAEDLETSGMTISPDSRYAYVNLNVNNALAEIDLINKEITQIWAYGYKDHSLLGNGLDVSDRDNAINITTWPLRSFLQPKDIAAFRSGGQTFIATANEGNLLDQDGFSEVTVIGDLPLDPQAFPDAEELKLRENLGRIDLTRLYGDKDGDGDFDALYTGGARSFSIFTTDGQRVFDSGDDFEACTAQAVPTCFNCPEDENNFDARSRKKGPEPEHVMIGRVGLRQYAFVSFERIGGIIVYDVTDPYDPKFQQYINNRNFGSEPATLCGERGEPALPTCEDIGDLEPEALSFIPAAISPLGVPMLVVLHEATDSTTFYRIDRL